MRKGAERPLAGRSSQQRSQRARAPLFTRHLLGTAFVASALALDVWGTAQLARTTGTANDLFPRWYGVRAWLLEGLDPYSPVVSGGIRQAMVGGPGTSGEVFVFGFVYPGYVALLLTPLAGMPFTLAATVWLLLVQATTLLGAWLCWRACERERGLPRAAPQVAMGVAALFPASLLTLLFLQFSSVVFVSLAASWFLLVRRRPGWAGTVLVFALIKPSLALVPTAALLLWGLAAGQGMIAVTWLLSALVLLGASLVTLPGWPASFWVSTADYARVAGATSAAGLLTGFLAGATPSEATAWRLAAAGLTGVFAGWAVLLGWRRSPRGAGDTLAAGSLLGAWLVPPLYEWNSMLLLVPLLVWLRLRAVRLASVDDPAGDVSPAWMRWKGYKATNQPLLLATVAVLTGSVLTVLAIARWPSESRMIWPLVILAVWTGRSERTASRAYGPGNQEHACGD